MAFRLRVKLPENRRIVGESDKKEALSEMRGLVPKTGGNCALRANRTCRGLETAPSCVKLDVNTESLK